MADTKISALTSGNPAQSTDEIPIARSGANFKITAGSIAALGGDVVGPASSVDDQIALFNSTTGKLIKAASTTGLLKASSGVIAAATSGTDYAPATSGTSILKGSGTGGFSNASAGSDYLAPPSGTALLKANSGGALANAVAGTDYAAATTGTNAQLLANNGSGGFSNVTVGSGLSLAAGTLTATGGGGGLTWQSVQTTGFTAVAGRAYPCNTTSASFTVTLPASASAGDQLIFTDYAGTFATNGLTLNPNGLKINGSTTSSGISGNRQSVALVYVDSVQGWISYADVSSQVLFGVPTSIEAVVVAGGASGGTGYGAGGGAGGYRTNSSFAITPGTSYTVTVGGGGAAKTSLGQIGANGSNSVFSTITSTGGGGGGTTAGNGNNGGSGGGGGGWIGPPAGVGGSGNTPSTSPSQGNNGGAGFDGSGNRGAGGGGGAGAVGTAGNTTAGGAGGNGSASSITGVSVTYAGGGGGGNMNPGNPSSGGTGGGGGGRGSDAAGVAGTANLGGGGGGSGGATSGAGGSGVVIIAYPSTFNNISSIGAGLTYTLDTTTRSGYKVYTFTAGTGTISW